MDTRGTNIGVHLHGNGSLLVSTYGRYSLTGGVCIRRFDCACFQTTGTQYQKSILFRDSRLSKGSHKRRGHHKDPLQLRTVDVRHKTMWLQLGSGSVCQRNESRPVPNPVPQQLTSNDLPLQHKKKQPYLLFRLKFDLTFEKEGVTCTSVGTVEKDTACVGILSGIGVVFYCYSRIAPEVYFWTIFAPSEN